MRDFAAWCEQEIYRIMPDADKHNYTGLNVPFRWYYGFLGEAIFEQFCKEQGLKYEYKPEVKGFADKRDFLLYDKSGPVSINVKTASRHYATAMTMPAKQFARRHSTVYAAVQIINSHSLGQVNGWATAQDIRQIQNKSYTVPMVGVPYAELRPMEKILNNAIKNK